MTEAGDGWTAGDGYERFMGRWSRPLARRFVDWLEPQKGARWLELGCGTGALTRAICEAAAPASLLACDTSSSFVEHARASLRDDRVSFVVADSSTLPGQSSAFDFAVSGLVLNFIPDPLAAISAMSARLSPGGVVAAYVWDYGEGMEFLRFFWDAAIAADPAARTLDEAYRFPLCEPESLRSLFSAGGLGEVSIEGVVIPTIFRDLDDLWMPFLRGVGPAGSYATSLPDEQREVVRARLASRLKAESDGSIRLTARAWAVRGRAGADPLRVG